MTLTTKSARKATASQVADPDKLCDVDVTDGRAVYWDGEQREGLVHNVPKQIAMEWLAGGLASVVYEPTPL